MGRECEGILVATRGNCLMMPRPCAHLGARRWVPVDWW